MFCNSKNTQIKVTFYLLILDSHFFLIEISFLEIHVFLSDRFLYQTSFVKHAVSHSIGLTNLAKAAKPYHVHYHLSQPDMAGSALLADVCTCTVWYENLYCNIIFDLGFLYFFFFCVLLKKCLLSCFWEICNLFYIA